MTFFNYKLKRPGEINLIYLTRTLYVFKHCYFVVFSTSIAP